MLVLKLQRQGAAGHRAGFSLQAWRGLPLGEFLIFNQELLAW